MHMYLEFDAIVRRFAEEKIRYAVAGALAVALHGFLRNTEDIDILVHPDQLKYAARILKNLGYRQGEPWTFKNSQITLWRFLKPAREPEDTIVVDIMVPQSPTGQAFLERAVELPYADLTVRVVTRSDLIAMKSQRHSGQDKVDIEKLQGGPSE